MSIGKIEVPEGFGPLYGAFPSAEQIAFRPSEVEPNGPKLLLSDLDFQLVGQQAIRPTPHARFILHALLLQPTGHLDKADFYELGYHPTAPNVYDKNKSFSASVMALMRDINQGHSVLEKTRRRYDLSVNLAASLQVERVSAYDIEVTNNTISRQVMPRGRSVMAPAKPKTPKPDRMPDAREQPIVLDESRRAATAASLRARGYSFGFAKSLVQGE